MYTPTELESFRFARGFILTRGPAAKKPNLWTTVQFGPWELSHDPRTQVSIAGANDSQTIIIGDAILPGLCDSSLESVQHVHNFNESELQEVTDELVGRFAIIALGKNASLRQDAAGMRAIYFSRTEPVFGSHPLLVAQQTTEAPSQFTRGYLKSNGLTCMPGRATEYKDVYALTPNTKISLMTRETTRTYHGQLSQETSVSEVSALLETLAQGQLNWLRSKNPVISLSAGLDSRTTLALLRPIAEKLSSFSYDLGSAQNRHSLYDTAMGKQIAEIAGLEHQTIRLRRDPIEDSLKKIFADNFHKPHGRELAVKYLQHLNHSVNVRSNIFGIGRDTYGKRSMTIKDGSAMGRLAFGSKFNDKASTQEFDKFIDETSFPINSDVDAKDLFLWEHRIGVWQSAIYFESDISHDSHVLVNQRRILKSLLSVPLADRVAGTVQKNVISANWPALTLLPVNGEPF